MTQPQMHQPERERDMATCEAARPCHSGNIANEIAYYSHKDEIERLDIAIDYAANAGRFSVCFHTTKTLMDAIVYDLTERGFECGFAKKIGECQTITVDWSKRHAE